jgi:hypothetical protein
MHAVARSCQPRGWGWVLQRWVDLIPLLARYDQEIGTWHCDMGGTRREYPFAMRGIGHLARWQDRDIVKIAGYCKVTDLGCSSMRGESLSTQDEGRD